MQRGNGEEPNLERACRAACGAGPTRYRRRPDGRGECLMNDLELTNALTVLADDHEPAEVDVDHIRTTFALRRRRRYAVAGTAVGVAVLVTGLIVATRSAAA